MDWEAEVSGLLAELSAAQVELLDVLQRKRERLTVADLPGLAALQPREEELATRLEDCQRRRNELLASARDAGLPGDSIGSLAAAASGQRRGKLGSEVKQVSARMRLLQNQGLTNWVLAQRSLLHVSQLVEIIATGGRMQPTYGDKESVHSRGSLVNQEA
jgi:hypothetical protein